MSGVNGGVKLFFAEELNADLDVTGINGGVNADVANVTVMGKLTAKTFMRNRIGGSPIRVSGVNGHVKLSRAGSRATSWNKPDRRSSNPGTVERRLSLAGTNNPLD